MFKRRVFAGGVASGSAAAAGVNAADISRWQKMLSLKAVYPVDAPGMPALSPDSAFLWCAAKMGDGSEYVKEKVKVDGKTKTVGKLTAGKSLVDLVRRAVYGPSIALSVSMSSTTRKDIRWFSGRLWNPASPSGPAQADVMIVSKMLSFADSQNGMPFSAEDADLIRDCLAELHIEDTSKFYVTYLNKFVTPKRSTTLASSWFKDGVYILAQEIALVRPKYILCLGTDAVKGVMREAHKISDCEGRVLTLNYDTRTSLSDTIGGPATAQVMVAVNPRQVTRDPAAIRQFKSSLSRFANLIEGRSIFGPQQSLDHRAVDNIPDMLSTLVEIEADQDKQDSVIAVDAEWHGAHPVNAGSYVRTVQLSWKPGSALCIKLHEAGGAITDGFNADGSLNTHLGKILTAFFCGGEIEGHKFRPKRVVGHFFNSDLEWLLDLGINIQSAFSCPLQDFVVGDDLSNPRNRTYIRDGFSVGEVVPAWYRTKYEGGADTGLMMHAIEETAQFDLSSAAMRYTTVPRYDTALNDWKTNFCKVNNIKSKHLEGYGECPDEILVPYSNHDADATLQLYYALHPLLDSDYEGNSCREAFWESQIATPAVLEIHRTGIKLNKSRVDQLYLMFSRKRAEMEQQLRDKIRWPDFNLRSVIHVRELLFGYQLNRKISKTGEKVKVSPDGAVSLMLKPVLDTGSPPKRWDEIDPNVIEEHAPSTNGNTVRLLLQDLISAGISGDYDRFRMEVLELMRDYRYIDQVIKTVLRPPDTIGEDDSEEFVYDEDGHLSFSEGLPSNVCDDGRIRTYIYQTKETGRWSSARPPMQTFAKKRDEDYVRILGDEYKDNRIRSVMQASEGHVLMEVDYIGAELFGMAVLSGDRTMIDHVIRNQLPEDHPDFYDIHSNVSVRAFRLPCQPTKQGLKDLGKSALRIIAKSILFGLAYGRGPAAISMEARQVGVDMTVDEAQEVIDTIFAMYPRLPPFLGEAKMRSTGMWVDRKTGKVAGRYLCNCFGRYRRFPKTRDKRLLGEFERQAMNFPLQSLVASAVSRAIAYLYAYREAYYSATGKSLFRILLQIHDALLLEVPYAHLKVVAEKVVPLCMRRKVPIYPADLGGRPLSDKPYYLGIDGEVMFEWGHKVSKSWAEERNLPTGVFSKDGVTISYSK